MKYRHCAYLLRTLSAWITIQALVLSQILSPFVLAEPSTLKGQAPLENRVKTGLEERLQEDRAPLPSAEEIPWTALMERIKLEASAARSVSSPSGIRQIFDLEGRIDGTSLGISDASKLKVATISESYLELLPKKPSSYEIVVGMDTRYTGPAIAEMMIRALVAHGVTVKFIGVAPIEETIVYAKKADGFLYISASHNPIGYNGLKVGLNNGRLLPVAKANALIASFEERLKDETYLRGLIERLRKVSVRDLNSVLEAVPAEREKSRQLYDDYSDQLITEIYPEMFRLDEGLLQADRKEEVFKWVMEQALRIQWYRRRTNPNLAWPEMRVSDEVQSLFSDETWISKVRDWASERKGEARELLAYRKEMLTDWLSDKGVQLAMDAIGGARYEEWKYWQEWGYQMRPINNIPREGMHDLTASNAALGPLKEAVAEMARSPVPTEGGVIFDTDGDRINAVFVEEDGNLLVPGVQKLFPSNVVVQVMSLLEDGRITPDQLKDVVIVVNDATSSIVEQLAKILGIQVVRVETAEANIVERGEELHREGKIVAFLGEGSTGGAFVLQLGVREPRHLLRTILRLETEPKLFAKWLGFMEGYPADQAWDQFTKRYPADAYSIRFADFLKTLPPEITTDFFSEAGIRRGKEVPMGLFKEEFKQHFMESLWQTVEEHLKLVYKGPISYEFVRYVGTKEIRGEEVPGGEPDSGSFVVEFFVGEGQNRHSIGYWWFRPSGTEAEILRRGTSLSYWKQDPALEGRMVAAHQVLEGLLNNILDEAEERALAKKSGLEEPPDFDQQFETLVQESIDLLRVIQSIRKADPARPLLVLANRTDGALVAEGIRSQLESAGVKVVTPHVRSTKYHEDTSGIEPDVLGPSFWEGLVTSQPHLLFVDGQIQREISERAPDSFWFMQNLVDLVNFWIHPTKERSPTMYHRSRFGDYDGRRLLQRDQTQPVTLYFHDKQVDSIFERFSSMGSPSGELKPYRLVATEEDLQRRKQERLDLYNELEKAGWPKLELAVLFSSPHAILHRTPTFFEREDPQFPGSDIREIPGDLIPQLQQEVAHRIFVEAHPDLELPARWLLKALSHLNETQRLPEGKWEREQILPELILEGHSHQFVNMDAYAPGRGMTLYRFSTGDGNPPRLFIRMGHHHGILYLLDELRTRGEIALPSDGLYVWNADFHDDLGSPTYYQWPVSSGPYPMAGEANWVRVGGFRQYLWLTHPVVLENWRIRQAVREMIRDGELKGGYHLVWNSHRVPFRENTVGSFDWDLLYGDELSKVLESRQEDLATYQSLAYACTLDAARKSRVLASVASWGYLMGAFEWGPGAPFYGEISSLDGKDRQKVLPKEPGEDHPLYRAMDTFRQEMGTLYWLEDQFTAAPQVALSAIRQLDEQGGSNALRFAVREFLKEKILLLEDLLRSPAASSLHGSAQTLLTEAKGLISSLRPIEGIPMPLKNTEALQSALSEFPKAQVLMQGLVLIVEPEAVDRLSLLPLLQPKQTLLVEVIAKDRDHQRQVKQTLDQLPIHSNIQVTVYDLTQAPFEGDLKKAIDTLKGTHESAGRRPFMVTAMTIAAEIFEGLGLPRPESFARGLDLMIYRSQEIWG